MNILFVCTANRDRSNGRGRIDGVSGEKEVSNGFCNGLKNRKEAKAYSIPKISSIQAKKNRLVAKNKERRLTELGWEICECCGKPADVDLAHLIPKSVRPDLYTKYDNSMVACRSCHTSFDTLDVFTIRKFHNLEKILSYIERNDTKRYLMIMDKRLIPISPPQK